MNNRSVTGTGKKADFRMAWKCRNDQKIHQFKELHTMFMTCSSVYRKEPH